MPEGCEIQESIRKSCLYDIWVPKRKYNINSKHHDGVSKHLGYMDSVLRFRDLIEKLRLRTLKDNSEVLLDAGVWSHFVSLTFPSIDEAVRFLPQLRVGADAFELRVDLLKDISIQSIHR